MLWSHYDPFLRGSVGSDTLSGVVRFFASSAGSGGVYLFFVLSAFLLFLPYARALVTPEHATWPRALTFYQRRMRRIIPAYLTVFIGMVALMLVELARRQAPLVQFPWRHLIPGLFLVYDLRPSSFELVAGNNPLLGYFDPPLWSLTVEWQFYLLLPLIAWVLSHLGSLRRVGIALLLVVAYGLVIRGAVVWLHYTGGVSTPAEAPGLLGVACALLYGATGKSLAVFALGMLASLFYVWGIEQQRWTSAQQRRLALILLPFGSFSYFFCALWWTFALRSMLYPGVWAPIQQGNISAMAWMIMSGVMYGFSSVALLLIVLCLPRSWGKVFNLRPLIFIGLISYSLYLWHWPLMILDSRFGTWLPPVAVLGLAFAWGAALYYLVERPFLRYRRQQ